MDPTTQYQIDSGGLGIFLVLYVVFILALYIVTAAGLWKMYVKAGRPGWAAIVPLYNWWVWVEIIERPRWWFWALLAAGLLSWIPLLGIALSVGAAVLWLLGCLDMAKRFGRGNGTGIGLWLLPFVFAPLLGFGNAEFESGRPGYGGTAWSAGMDTMSGGVQPPAPVAPTTMAMTATQASAPAASWTPAPPAAASASAGDDFWMSTASPAPFGPPAASGAAGSPSHPTSSPASASGTTVTPAPAPSWPPVDGHTSAPYTLAPRSAPVAPLGSWPPAPAKS